MNNKCPQCLETNKFLTLNPFVDVSVGEDVIWEGDFQDLQSINKDVSETMLMDIEDVKSNSRKMTRLRFIVGAPGSGKSHLFARLRRQCAGRGWYCLVLNPPANEDTLILHMLRSVIRSLSRHLVITSEGERKGYSQLRLLVYELIRRHIKDYSIEDIDELWRTRINNPRLLDAQAQRDAIVAQLTPILTDKFKVSLHIIRALLYVPMDGIGYLAEEWLSGSNKLTDEDLKAINQSDYLDEASALELLYFLGKLSASFDYPIVLVLDQLDALSSPEPIKKYDALLMGLRDQSCNWAVFVSLIEENYMFWFNTLSEALKQRFNEHANLKDIGNAERDSLIRERLKSKALMGLRLNASCPEDLCPLTEADVKALAENNELFYPRKVLSKASELYKERIKMPLVRAVSPLLDMLSVEFGDMLDGARTDYPRPDEIATDEIWARAIEVMKVTLGREDALKVEKGPLHKDRNFKGIDTLITLGGGARLRLVCHDIPTTAFLNLLKKLNGSPDKILLLRNGRVKTSGRKTQEQLGEFTSKGNTFLHLKDDEMYAMLALGKLLAKAREGNYAHLTTEPACTYDNILGTLAQVEQLEGHGIAGYIKDLVHPALPPPTQTKIPPPPSPPLPSIKPPADISSIMRRERWLALERLRLLLMKANVQMSSHALLESARAVSDISIHRISEKDPEFVILVWQGEA